MKALEEIYRGGFFKNRHRLNWRVPIVCDAIMKVFKPKSVMDVGCAIGDYVNGFLNKGIDSYGIEGSEAAKPFLVTPETHVVFTDLRSLFYYRYKYCDLVLCFEVAEHIEPEYTNVFMRNLTRMGDKILVTAAGPGQGGHYHVNCQEPQYWIDLFSDKGYQLNSEVMEAMKKEWEPWKNKKGMNAYYQNLLYFEKG